ncbi:MAG: hypothetical protein SF052_20630 [Bacteroidia bacterium]|nr:hypothetical protein [Bacteroidia bacterium]
MIRNIFFTLVFFAGVFVSFAQQPEPISRITREFRDYNYYLTQTNLWKKVTATTPRDENAWLNYYEANRAAGIVNEGKRPENTDNLLAEMKKHLPESAVWNYLMYRNGGNDLSLFPYLEKAYRLRPDMPQILEEMVTYYEFSNKPEKRKEFNRKWFETGAMPEELLAFNHNVLVSLEPNALIFTNGDNDTYPAWMLQDVMNVRPDVIVLNRSLALSKPYISGLFLRHKIADFTFTPTSDGYAAYQDKLVAHILANAQRPLHFALTVAPESIKNHKENLYVVGLASKYSNKRFDNLAVLAKNVEEQFLLDHLNINFSYVSPYSSITPMRSTYLTPLLMLHQYYTDKKQTPKAAELKKLIQKIAVQTQREEEVKKILGE